MTACPVSCISRCMAVSCSLISVSCRLATRATTRHTGPSHLVHLPCTPRRERVMPRRVFGFRSLEGERDPPRRFGGIRVSPVRTLRSGAFHVVFFRLVEWWFCAAHPRFERSCAAVVRRRPRAPARCRGRVARPASPSRAWERQATHAKRANAAAFDVDHACTRCVEHITLHPELRRSDVKRPVRCQTESTSPVSTKLQPV